MNCTVQIRILWLILLSKASFPYNRTLFSLCQLSDKGRRGDGGGVLSMFIKSFMRISRISLKNWHYRKKYIVVLASMHQEYNEFKVSSKLGSDVNKTIWVDLQKRCSFFATTVKRNSQNNCIKSFLFRRYKEKQASLLAASRKYSIFDFQKNPIKCKSLFPQ